MRLQHERICPIVQLSSVDGNDLDKLQLMLNLLPTSAVQYVPRQSGSVVLPISDVFSVPFVGTVASGVLTSGTVKVGDNLALGPDGLGHFIPTVVRSIHCKRVNVESAVAGHSICVALKRVRRAQVRKGMVLATTQPNVFRAFDAEVLCLYHSATLSVGSCMVLHAGCVRQTVRILHISKPVTDYETAEDRPIVRMGDRAMVRLEFVCSAEYIWPGLRLVARECVIANEWAYTTGRDCPQCSIVYIIKSACGDCSNSSSSCHRRGAGRRSALR